MKAKSLFFMIAGTALLTSCSSIDSTSASLSTAADTASFYLGYNYGQNLASAPFELDMKAFIAGMNSAKAKKDIGVSQQEMGMFFQKFIAEAQTKDAEKNLKEGREFLAKKAKESGIDSLPGGILYKVEKAGDGAKPAVTDKVKVHYTGTFIDGEKFDSSYDHKDPKTGEAEPAEFKLNQVIPGWTQALQAMPVGSKWTVYIPTELAYGERGIRGAHQNAALIFEVELLDIVADEETPETSVEK